MIQIVAKKISMSKTKAPVSRGLLRSSYPSVSVSIAGEYDIFNGNVGLRGRDVGSAYPSAYPTNPHSPFDRRESYRLDDPADLHILYGSESKKLRGIGQQSQERNVL